MSTETKPKNESRKIPFVDYLVLDDPPYLQAQECTNCGARYFDRRNACANCFKDKFTPVAIATEGEVTSFSIVQMGATPYISAVVDCGGTSVKCTIINVEPTPEEVRLGMKVKLATYPMGQDSEGTEAIAFGFEPI
tara:strand:+ start:257 stop:664 length:408 start_codon:yes stop_codon:yes gene_type:complete